MSQVAPHPATPAPPAPASAPIAPNPHEPTTPLDWLAGPVFQKEMRIAGRRTGTYWTRSLFALGLIGLVSIVYAAMASESWYYSGAARIQQFQHLAPGLAIAIAWFELIAVTLAAPMLTGGAICDERRFGSLSALATTPLRPSQIVLGKFISRLVQVFILTLTTAPLLLALRAFGGLEASFVLAATVLTLSSGMLAAALAMWASNAAKRPTNAASFAVLMMVLFNIWPFGAMLLQYWSTGRPPSVNWLLCSPAFALFACSGPRIPAPFNPASAWLGISVATMALTLLVLVAASWRLGSLIRRDAAAEPATATRKKPRKSAPLPAPAVVNGVEVAAPPPDLESRRSSRTVGDNPVLWREWRQSAFRSRTRLILGLVLAGVLAFIVYANAGLDEAGTTIAFGSISMLLILMQATLSGAGAITGEVESRTWATLITTTLTPQEIIWGKIAGAVRRLWIVPTLFMAHCLLAVLAGANGPVVLVLVPLIIVGPLVFLCTTGVMLSLRSRKTTTAGVLNFLIGAGLWAGLPMVVGMLTSIGRFTPQSLVGDLFKVVVCGNPMFLIVAATEGTGLGRHGPSGRFELPWQRVGLDSFLPLCLTVTAVYLAGAWLAYRATNARFARWSANRA